MLVVLPLILGLIGFMGYKMYKGYQAKAGQQTEQITEKDSLGILNGNPLDPKNQAAMMPQSSLNGGDLTPEMFVPTLAEKPESKPLYNSVRQVRAYERIAACVDGGQSGCTCYSDQATQLAEVTDAMCREYVKHGIPFNPYKDDSQAVQTAYSQPADTHATSGGQVAVMGGKSPQSLMYDNHAQGRLN